MIPEDIYHIQADFSLGKCNFTLRTWCLLSNIEEVEEKLNLEDYFDMGCETVNNLLEAFNQHLMAHYTKMKKKD